MTRVFALAVALAAAALVGAGQGAADRAQTPKLFASVGPGFGISLKNADGTQVTKVDPGTYDVVVKDLADEHSFHLTGPGVDRRTDVSETGEVTWTVTFTEAVYQYFCDVHPLAMRGTFTVGNPPSTTPPPTPGVVTAKSKLVLTAGPEEVITLKTSAGKAVKTMKLGTYTMVVRDRGRIHNAHVIAPGYNRKTSPLTFVGTQTWKVKLAKAGTLRFMCDPHALTGMKGSAKIVR